MKETCQLTFSTTLGRRRVVSINDPRAGLTGIQAQGAAGAFISANPFDAETGALVELLSAHHVVVDSAVIVPPEVA
jgi:hypothetical protein